MRQINVVRQINVKILNPAFYEQWDLPQYATPESAGLDLRACIDTTVILDPKDKFLCPTGLAVDLNDAELALFLLPKSGLGHKKGLILGNSVGLVDSDYHQEIFVSLWNQGTETLQITPGMFVAQAYFAPIVRVEFNVVKQFNRTVERTGGFGSTGTH
jgi:dUTP pyrophosphatase